MANFEGVPHWRMSFKQHSLLSTHQLYRMFSGEKKNHSFFLLLYITVLYKCRPSTNCISPNGGFELLHSHFGLSVDNFEFWSRHACNVFKAIQLCIRFAVACHTYFLWPFRPTPNLFHPPMPSRSHSVFFLFLSFSNV